MKATTPNLQLWAVLVWAVLIGLGMSLMDRYENTPGRSQLTPDHWPAITSLSHSRDFLTVLVFVHPQCPCTRATLQELATLSSRAAGQVYITVIAIVPASRVDTWRHAPLLQQAAAIPRAKLYYDIDGVEARRFGAASSGYTAVYDPSGALRFHGGITAARGETGDSYGIRALENLADLRRSSRDATPVFGCELSNAVGFQPR